MRYKMLRVVAALMCVLAAGADVTPVKDFNLEKMAGKWYMIGIASNAQWFTSNRTNTKMGTTVFEPTAEGDMDMYLSHVRLKDDGTCWRITHLINKTDTPGRFTFHSQEWNNDNDMRIVDIQYDDYALVHTIKTKDEESNIVNELLSRTQEASVAQQEKFRQYSLDTGILPDNILILPKNNECPEMIVVTAHPTVS